MPVFEREQQIDAGAIDYIPSVSPIPGEVLIHRSAGNSIPPQFRSENVIHPIRGVEFYPFAELFLKLCPSTYIVERAEVKTI